MRKLNYARMRKDTADFIAADPSTVVVYRAAKASGDPEVTYTWTGRITTASNRATLMTTGMRGSSTLRGEHGQSPLGWVLVAEWDIDGGITGADELRITNNETGITQIFHVNNAAHFSDKWEALIDAVQP